VAYRLLADTVMVVHFAFLGYVLAGGFLAWRWPRAIWPHLLLAGWGGGAIVFRLNCPLTWLEDRARRRAGGPGLPDGFVDHYLTGVLYPRRLAGLVLLLVVLVVAVSWSGALVLLVRRRRDGHPARGRS